MGVWIEITGTGALIEKDRVTPCVGVWIEIARICAAWAGGVVTPCVGVWIEIVSTEYTVLNLSRHSLRGSVD